MVQPWQTDRATYSSRCSTSRDGTIIIIIIIIISPFSLQNASLDIEARGPGNCCYFYGPSTSRTHTHDRLHNDRVDWSRDRQVRCVTDCHGSVIAMSPTLTQLWAGSLQQRELSYLSSTDFLTLITVQLHSLAVPFFSRRLAKDDKSFLRQSEILQFDSIQITKAI